MRQVGVLAAAAMYGLDTADERISQDHINAKRLSSGLMLVEKIHALIFFAFSIERAQSSSQMSSAADEYHVHGHWQCQRYCARGKIEGEMQTFLLNCTFRLSGSWHSLLRSLQRQYSLCDT